MKRESSGRTIPLMEVERGSLICKLNEVNFAEITPTGGDYRTILLLRYPEEKTYPKMLGQGAKV